MATVDRYAHEIESLEWTLASEFDTTFEWEYEAGSQALRALYGKGKRLQWDAETRIDWSQDLDPENPQGLPNENVILWGSDVWRRMTRQEQTEFRRHVEAYSRLLHEKFEPAYPINPELRHLLDNTFSGSRWDMTYLGMQLLVEGLALAAFANIRDNATNPLAAAVNAYVMQDEARHVAFGRLTLRDYYPHLSDAERDEREEFAVEACYLMRDRLLAREVFETLGLPVDECMAHATGAAGTAAFRSRLFTRIIPTMKDIGLWGPRIRKAYVDAEDERAALEFDARARGAGR